MEREESEPKEKQWIQDKEVLLYKSYEVNLPKSKTLESRFIQDEINNLNKYMMLWSMPPRDSMEKGKGYDDMIGCTTSSLS